MLHAISVRDEEAAARTVENHIRAFYFNNVVGADGQSPAGEDGQVRK